MAEKKQWSEMSPTQKGLIVAGGTVELVLTTWAAIDLIKRPGEQVRGPKLLWAPALIVQPVGPIAYLVIGRRKEG
jgi:hypothetical protein